MELWNCGTVELWNCETVKLWEQSLLAMQATHFPQENRVACIAGKPCSHKISKPRSDLVFDMLIRAFHPSPVFA